MAKTIQITFDAADPRALADFWAAALDYVVQPPPEGFATWDEALTAFGVPQSEWNSRSALIDPDGVGPRIFIQRVPEPKTAKNRLHIDIRVAGEGPWDMAERERLIRAKVPELVALGAAVVREERYGGPELGHVVMTDPEGNEFCVA